MNHNIIKNRNSISAKPPLNPGVENANHSETLSNVLTYTFIKRMKGLISELEAVSAIGKLKDNRKIFGKEVIRSLIRICNLYEGTKNSPTTRFLSRYLNTNGYAIYPKFKEMLGHNGFKTFCLQRGYFHFNHNLVANNVPDILICRAEIFMRTFLNKQVIQLEDIKNYSYNSAVYKKNLVDFIFSMINLGYTDLNDLNLSGLDFSYRKLSDINFKSSIFRDTIFKYTKSERLNLDYATFLGAKFEGNVEFKNSSFYLTEFPREPALLECEIIYPINYNPFISTPNEHELLGIKNKLIEEIDLSEDDCSILETLNIQIKKIEEENKKTKNEEKQSIIITKDNKTLEINFVCYISYEYASFPINYCQKPESSNDTKGFKDPESTKESSNIVKKSISNKVIIFAKTSPSLNHEIIHLSQMKDTWEVLLNGHRSPFNEKAKSDNVLTLEQFIKKVKDFL